MPIATQIRWIFPSKLERLWLRSIKIGNHLDVKMWGFTSFRSLLYVATVIFVSIYAAQIDSTHGYDMIWRWQHVKSKGFSIVTIVQNTVQCPLKFPKFSNKFITPILFYSDFYLEIQKSFSKELLCCVFSRVRLCIQFKNK